MGRGHVPRDLPAPRLGVRPRDGRSRCRCRRTSRCRSTPSRSRTGSCRSRSSNDRRDPLLGDERPALQRLPRRGVGPPGARRARALRAALPRGLPVGALVADDPAQARSVPRRVRRLRPGAGRALRRARRERLLADAGIVRHRGKIEAAIANARATVALRGSTPLHELLWSYAPGAQRSSTAPTGRRRRVGRAREGAAKARLPLRRPDDGATPPCRHAASSTTTSPTAGCVRRSRRSARPLSPRSGPSAAAACCAR